MLLNSICVPDVRVDTVLFCDMTIRFNYKMGDVFRELMGCTQPGYAGNSDPANGSRNKGKCTIL